MVSSRGSVMVSCRGSVMVSLSPSGFNGFSSVNNLGLSADLASFLPGFWFAVIDISFSFFPRIKICIDSFLSNIA